MTISTKFLREIDDKIGLKRLYEEGVINAGVARLLSIRDKVDALVSAGKTHGQAVDHVSRTMGMTRQHIYRLLEPRP